MPKRKIGIRLNILAIGFCNSMKGSVSVSDVYVTIWKEVPNMEIIKLRIRFSILNISSSSKCKLNFLFR